MPDQFAPDTIRVLIADDQKLFVESLRQVLNNRGEEIVVVGAAYDGETAVSLTEELAPDVVLMDVRMPVLDGVRATKAIRHRFPMVHVIMLTMFDDDEYVREALKAGAAGYLLKDMTPEDLISCLRLAKSGNVMLTPSSMQSRAGQSRSTLDNHEPADPALAQALRLLSQREREVLDLLARGYSNSRIASTLFLAEQTVKNHVSAIYDKLHLENRYEVIRLADKLRELSQ